MSDTVCILLAAGNSSRLGTPKQLIRFNDDYLINHILDGIEASVCEKAIIVLGSGANEMGNIVKSTKSVIVINSDWEKGMGSSIKAGLEYAIKNSPGLASVLILVCDQYKLNSETINNLLQNSKEHPGKIIASSYTGTIGIPALFPSTFFELIKQIPDNKGCKEIIHSNMNDVIAVAFPGGELDIDEEGDIPNTISF